MKIRNGETPIQLPEVIRAGDPITAKWANGIRGALQRLRDRTPIITGANLGGSVYNHPFKIVVEKVDSEIRAIVWNGAVTYQSWSTEDQPIYFEADITINTGALRGDPFPVVPEGYYALTVDTDYGVWLKLARTPALEVFANPAGTSEPYAALNFYGTTTNCEVIVTSSFVNKSSTPTYDDDYDFAYIGKISIDADGLVSILQYRKSDFITSVVTWPVDFSIISSDAGNSITAGSDNGAFYEAPPTVSADAGNNITTGTDGGAYYDDPDY